MYCMTHNICVKRQRQFLINFTFQQYTYFHDFFPSEIVQRNLKVTCLVNGNIELCCMRDRNSPARSLALPGSQTRQPLERQHGLLYRRSLVHTRQTRGSQREPYNNLCPGNRSRTLPHDGCQSALSNQVLAVQAKVRAFEGDVDFLLLIYSCSSFRRSLRRNLPNKL